MEDNLEEKIRPAEFVLRNFFKKSEAGWKIEDFEQDINSVFFVYLDNFQKNIEKSI